MNANDAILKANAAYGCHHIPEMNARTRPPRPARPRIELPGAGRPKRRLRHAA